MSKFLSTKQIIDGYKIVFQKNMTEGQLKELNKAYCLMKEAEEAHQKALGLLYIRDDRNAYLSMSEEVDELKVVLDNAQKAFYKLEGAAEFEKYFAPRVRPITEKDKKIEDARVAHVNKINEIIKLFRDNDIILDTGNDEIHASYFVWNGKKVFLCQCDGEYDSIASVTLKKIETIQKAFMTGNANHIKEYKEFFTNFDLTAVTEKFEKLNKEDQTLYSDYVKLYTERD